MARNARLLCVLSCLAACGPDEDAGEALGTSEAAISQCGPRLWVAHDTSTVRGDEDAYWNCVLGHSNFSTYTSAYASANGGTALYYGGAATISSPCSVVHSTSATVANDSATLQCIENQTHWPIGTNDVILYYPQGYGCQDGRNHWGIPVTAPGGASVTLKAAFAFTSTGQACQEALGFHEAFEAAGQWSGADCCNGQDGCTAPTAYGWYSFSACGGTWYAQYITPAAHEFDSAYCTQLAYNQNIACNLPMNPTSQLTGNEAITAVNWPNTGEVEVFVKTTGGNAVHVYTNPATSDTWTQDYPLTGSAECWLTSIMWPPPRGYFAELFDPTSTGSTQHLWWSGSWNAFSGFGGPSGASVSGLGTLAWNDGHAELFALGSDGQIWHIYWSFSANAWSSWGAMVGTNLVTAPSPILWMDGHGELFATDSSGVVWHTWSGSGTAFPNGWHAWASLGGNVASRPIPVRWADGHVQVFARGSDNTLYETHWTTSGWTPFAQLNGTTVQGDPSAIVNVSGKGASPGPEIFARDSSNQVVHLWWNGSSWTPWGPMLGQSTASDPFAWIRNDGSAVVFTVDSTGSLVKTYHDPTHGWTAWASIGSGIDACVPPPPPAPDAGSTTDAGTSGGDAGSPKADAGPGARDAGEPGADAGTPGGDSGSTTKDDGGLDTVRTGCGCDAGAASTAPIAVAVLGLALPLCRRRRRG